jgi:hypothetical protein
MIHMVESETSLRAAQITRKRELQTGTVLVAKIDTVQLKNTLSFDDLRKEGDKLHK